MLHNFAVTHPLMTIAIALFGFFYLGGVCLLIAAMTRKPEWFEDENGNLHHVINPH